MDLTNLMKLQEIDKRLMELEEFKGDLPERVEELKTRMASLTEELSKIKSELDEISKQKLSTENEIKILKDKLHKYQEQIYSVKTNKEYDAITTEIENLENKISEIELNGVVLLEKEEKYIEKNESIQNKIDAGQNELESRETELSEKLSATESEEKLLLNKRSTIAKDVNPRLLANYNRIRKGKNGIAIVQVEKYTCTGCYTTLPAQVVVEVRKMNRIITCEVCGRILVAQISNKVEAAEESSIANL